MGKSEIESQSQKTQTSQSSHHITWWRRTQTRRPLFPKNTL